jgi:1-acyl-sn-glycerol-3-phosphate acyltransferase
VTPAGRVPAAWRGRVNQVVGHVLFGLAYRVDVEGGQRVPRSGPILFVGNHVGFLDGPLLPAYAPRPTTVLVKREMFRGPLGWFLTFLGHIPVTRNAGDRGALQLALSVLGRDSGGAVGIFPEGTRGRGDVAAVQQGAAWLALQSGAQLVPVAFLGTRATGAHTGSLPRLRSRLVMEFGEAQALEVDRTHSGRQRLADATEQVRVALAEHVARAAAEHGLALPEDDGAQSLDPGPGGSVS